MDSIKKKYDNSKYINNFIKNHKEEIKKSIECSICKGKYKYFSKTKHLKTKKHLNFII